MTLMNDLVERIFNAIIRQEGMPSDHTNPGNLRDCPWFTLMPTQPNVVASRQRRYPDGTPVKYENGFWVPRTRAEGIAGGGHVIHLHIAMGNTLAQAISSWAPPGDNNNTPAYIEHVKEWADIPDELQPLWNFIETVPT